MRILHGGSCSPPFQLEQCGHRLHGHVSRRMWQKIWPRSPESDLPIVHVQRRSHPLPTYPKHAQSTSTATLSPRWIESRQWRMRGWTEATSELWRTEGEERKARRVHADEAQEATGQDGRFNRELALADEVLTTETLTSGLPEDSPLTEGHLVSRRLWLEKILANSERPVQIYFCRQARPQDTMARPDQQLIQTTNGRR